MYSEYKKFFKHRLFRNTSALLIMQLFTYVSPFLVLPYLSRTLGADGFGVMIAALSLTIFANIITDFGFNLSATYLISRKQNNKNYISKLVSTIYLLKCIMLIPITIGIYSYIYFSSKYSLLAISAIYITIYFQSFLSPWYFQGIEKMKLITYSTIVSRIIYIGLIFFLVKSKGDYDIALMCHAVSTIISFILATMFMYKENVKWIMPTNRLLKTTLLHSSQFFLSRLMLSASSSISVLVLASCVSSVQVGLFGASQKIFNAFKQLINPFSQALYPYMASTGNTKLLLRFVLIIAIVMLVPSIIGFIFSEQILIIIFGSEFSSSYETLRLFILTGYIAFFSVCFGYPAFASIKRVDLANKSVILSGLLQLLLLSSLYLTNNINISSITYSILLTESVTFLIRILWFIKLTKIK